MLNHEKLKCLCTGLEIKDDGLVLSNPKSEEPSLIRAIYNDMKFQVRDRLPGLFRFSQWLPIQRILEGSGAPVTYKSVGLSKHLGLDNLYITFNGYWPEKEAYMTTGSFKECEAYSVCARFPEGSKNALVIASAGNTARAFMKVGSENNIPVVIVVPEKNLVNLWSTNEINPCVKVVCAGGDSDYFDAIRLSELICQIEGFYPEGGAKNVARRDGMGTTVLSAVTTIGKIPDYYFQAIGSGTGAIAAYEANLRFIESGEYENKKMKLMVSQNEPFVPIYNAWKAGKSTIDELDEEEALRQIEIINAKVLSNRKPPYSVKGGLYEALVDTKGDVLTATNEEAIKAQELFYELEGCDICPEAGIAMASMIKSVNKGIIPNDAIVMLNVTGGGLLNIKAEFDIKPAKPDLVIDKNDFNVQKIKERIINLFRGESNGIY